MGKVVALLPSAAATNDDAPLQDQDFDGHTARTARAFPAAPINALHFAELELLQTYRPAFVDERVGGFKRALWYALQSRSHSKPRSSRRLCGIVGKRIGGKHAALFGKVLKASFVDLTEKRPTMKFIDPRHRHEVGVVTAGIKGVELHGAQLLEELRRRITHRRAQRAEANGYDERPACLFFGKLAECQ